MATKSSEEQLEWTDIHQPLSIEQVCEDFGLPALVYVVEGIYSSLSSETFSGGDYLKLHGCEVLEKVMTYPTRGEEGKYSEYFREWDKPWQIPLDYRVKVRVVPKHGETRVYPTVEQLVEDFPRFVRVGMDIVGTDQSGTQISIPRWSCLELLHAPVKSKANHVVCSFKRKNVKLSLNCTGRFSIIPDRNTYTLREVVGRFPPPQVVEFIDEGRSVTKSLTDEARVALSNLETFTGKVIVDNVITEEVVYGTHRLEYHEMIDLKLIDTTRQAIAVIPLTSEASFQVAINKESAIYSEVFSENYMRTLKTSKIAALHIDASGSGSRKILVSAAELEEADDSSTKTERKSKGIPGDKRHGFPHKATIGLRTAIDVSGGEDKERSSSGDDYEPVDEIEYSKPALPSRKTLEIQKLGSLPPALTKTSVDGKAGHGSSSLPLHEQKHADKTKTHKRLGSKVEIAVKFVQRVVEHVVPKRTEKGTTESLLVSRPIGRLDSSETTSEANSSDEDEHSYEEPDDVEVPLTFSECEVGTFTDNTMYDQDVTTSNEKKKDYPVQQNTPTCKVPQGIGMKVLPLASVQPLRKPTDEERNKASSPDSSKTPHLIPKPSPIAPKPRAIKPMKNISLAKDSTDWMEQLGKYSVEQLHGFMQSLGLGYKADLFYKKRIDGEIFLIMTDDMLKNGPFYLTDLEFMQVKRFKENGKLPKMQ